MDEETKEVSCCSMGTQYLRETIPAKSRIFRNVELLAEEWGSGAVIEGYAIEHVQVKFCPWCGCSFKKPPRRHNKSQQRSE